MRSNWRWLISQAESNRHMAKKATERLEELLEVKDQRIEELESELQKYEDAKEEEKWRWCIHENLPEHQTLPVPRLEMVFEPEYGGDDWYNTVIKYRLIYRHFLNHCVAVPLGHTKRGGGRKPTLDDVLMDLPFRDGAHIRHDARSFGFPAFAICEEVVVPIPTEPIEK
jgi:hypothetical protein